jgi:IS30 family transposase
MRSQRCSYATVARVLGKSRVTVWREVRRNTNAAGIYYEVHAQTKMRERRREAKAPYRIIENDLQLESWVERMLKFHFSPEQIAGYMRRTNQSRPLCPKTIYSWVHRRWQSRKAYLRFKGRPRIPYGARKRAWQPHKRHISERPAIVRRRLRVGDWEADLVHGTRDDSRHALLTLNDRASGFCIIRKVTTYNPVVIAYMMVNALKGLPCETITCDNGIEFAYHRTIEKRLGCHVYFADPYSPQQRGSNENLNGLLREFFPKGVSLSQVTQLHATEAAIALNRRPRKRFGYDCPRQLFAAKSGLSPHFSR